MKGMYLFYTGSLPSGNVFFHHEDRSVFIVEPLEVWCNYSHYREVISWSTHFLAALRYLCGWVGSCHQTDKIYSVKQHLRIFGNQFSVGKYLCQKNSTLTKA